MQKISEFIITWMLQFMLCYGLDYVRHNYKNVHQLEVYLIVFDRFQKNWFPWWMECDGWKKIPLHFKLLYQVFPHAHFIPTYPKLCLHLYTTISNNQKLRFDYFWLFSKILVFVMDGMWWMEEIHYILIKCCIILSHMCLFYLPPILNLVYSCISPSMTIEPWYKSVFEMFMNFIMFLEN